MRPIGFPRANDRYIYLLLSKTLMTIRNVSLKWIALLYHTKPSASSMEIVSHLLMLFPSWLKYSCQSSFPFEKRHYEIVRPLRFWKAGWRCDWEFNLIFKMNSGLLMNEDDLLSSFAMNKGDDYRGRYLRIVEVLFPCEGPKGLTDTKGIHLSDSGIDLVPRIIDSLASTISSASGVFRV